MVGSVLTPQILSLIQEKAAALGFDRVGFSNAVVPASVQQSFISWCDGDRGAEMEHLSRDRHKRLDPKRLFPYAQTVISLAVGYFQGVIPSKPGPGFGRVARYAWGRDYHDVISARLTRLVDSLKNEAGLEANMIQAVDSVPLLEKAFAKSGGVGFTGKNSILILPRRKIDGERAGHMGSWVFLGEIITDLELSEEILPAGKLSGCGDCTKCLDSCPTRALGTPYSLNAGLCISYLTIENKNWIPRELREKMGDWIFGCDLCQEVCPFNGGVAKTGWEEFDADKGSGPWIKLEEILTTPDSAAHNKRWQGTALLRPRRRGLVRNACVAAGNSGDEALIPHLTRLLGDPEPVVRGHALWALSRLLPVPKAKRLAAAHLQSDPDENVQGECRIILK